MRKILPLIIEKYDITHKILNELSNLESRYILFSIIAEPKSIQMISKELKIPLSSVHKKIRSLQENALISSELKFLKSGRKTRLFQSRITDAEITISEFEPIITFKKNLKNRYD